MNPSDYKREMRTAAIKRGDCGMCWKAKRVPGKVACLACAKKHAARNSGSREPAPIARAFCVDCQSPRGHRANCGAA
jgi:hypothetical protein